MKTIAFPRSSAPFFPETAIGAAAPNLGHLWTALRESDRSISRGIVVQDLLQDISDVARMAASPDWNGEGADPVEEGAVEWAWVFAACLPTNVPMPEVGADADGDVAFEWFRGPRRVLSVSIRRDGVLNYAALIGRSRKHGTETLRDGLPAELVQIIHRVVGS